MAWSAGALRGNRRSHLASDVASDSGRADRCRCYRLLGRAATTQRKGERIFEQSLRVLVLRPPLPDYTWSLDHLEQQGGRYRDSACRGRCNHACVRREYLRADVAFARRGPKRNPRSASVTRRGSTRFVKTVTIAPAPDGVAISEAASSSRPVADFAELVKARLTLLVLLTTAVGFYLGAPEGFETVVLLHVVFGTALAAAGAAALNQWWERRLDALMHRTRTRPIPGGRMLPRDALILGGLLSFAGITYLAVACNPLSAFLAALTIAIY